MCDAEIITPQLKSSKTAKTASKSSESSDDSDSSDDSENENSEQKITQSSQKKRGRPKKIVAPVVQKSIPVQKVQIQEKEEELILHIPIYDDEDNSSEKNMFTMKDESEDSFKKKGKTVKIHFHI